MENWREGAHAGHTHEPNEVTIQLDGLGRQLSELLPEPSAPDGSDGPVFVDESGRRGKTLRRLGWVLAAVFVCYAVTLVIAVLGGNSSAPSLPISGHEDHQKTEEVQAPASPDASPSTGASAGASTSAPPSVPQPQGSAALPGGTGTERSTAPGTSSSVSTRVTPKGDTGTAGSSGGSTPSGETTASGRPADAGTPVADPDPPVSDTTLPTAEPPDPPAEEREGAN
ncbi:hypothetical protein E6P78_03550 [Streptomyces sp. A0958]|uniref:hypothetical protein n=1 Tax=Streptomyces sp. A0958 TaxID=2563101 RepID=UPI00109E5AE4|nr:hypothetical protein [Streptomyces sp. A0958]THA72351.1 hypothetical protein E6P78_03550 [Streptomyces sp. A0958]